MFEVWHLIYYLINLKQSTTMSHQTRLSNIRLAELQATNIGELKIQQSLLIITPDHNTGDQRMI